MLYCDTSYISISYDAASHAVLSIWKTAPTSTEFRMAMNKTIDAIRDHQTGRIVSDTRNLGAISPENQEWSNNDWAPRAIAVGYQKIAIVLPADVFGQISVEDIMNKVGDLSFHYFNSMEEGIKWISQN